MGRYKDIYTARSPERHALQVPLSFTCLLGECRSELLPLLSEVSKAVSAGGTLGKTLTLVMDLLQKHLHVARAMISLYDTSCDQIFIHESYGLTKEEVERGVYYPGEGITGKVIETRQSIIVPLIVNEPRFLNRTGSWKQREEEHLSFICVPIIRGAKVMGTISMERLYNNNQLLLLDLEVLGIVATTIAQAVELHLLEVTHRRMLREQSTVANNALIEKFKPANIIGNSRPMQKIYRLLEKVSPASTTVLILGESGVGKERIASAIHYNSGNARGPFIRFNCASLPETVIESELFGHEKGAFTGAIARRAGRFEEADGGTLFLDEIGELSPSVQTKLLRVLQERSFERVGSNQTLRVNVRILTATHRNLRQMVAEGTFREDLFYRLNVFPVTVPPLRDRGSDILILADHFIAQFAREQNVKIPEISIPAMSLLLSYDWPGNVRELENMMERAVLLAEDGIIHCDHLMINMQPPPVGADSTANGGIESRLAQIEYDLIDQALGQHHGNISRAASQLGMTRRALGLRMEKYQLDYKTYRRRAQP
ncbi:GAF domain-containing protein [Affinibrenneria salicis]|uniref:GAF domain-containing protein n=1 Tax=Affinibrenneria salicis TaxID=2590031 RepID=A0A5J5G168_9GAMM|nr:sigma 54-interacting transcriptional regulator [Affinibrenneria salicis]KAA9000496.1 GAF domain-containing protein [Affinibrenneria salicis]